jgi:hypothetical protein
MLILVTKTEHQNELEEHINILKMPEEYELQKVEAKSLRDKIRED